MEKDVNASIKEARADDIPVIRRMADIVFRRTYRDILSPEQMEYMMDWMYSENSLLEQICGEGRTFLIALYDDEPCGYASFEIESTIPDGRPLFHLQKLYVMPQYQRSGIGQKLVRAILDRLHSAAPSGFRVELNVNRNNPAIGFYEHIGFHRDRQGDFPIGHGYYMNDYIYVLDTESI